MSGKRSRNKGKAGERELSKELTRLFGVQCRRGVQYNGLDGHDVIGLPGVHIECKRTETLSLYPAMAQAKNDAAENEVPAVFHRRNGKDWLAVIELERLPELVSQLYLIMCEEG